MFGFRLFVSILLLCCLCCNCSARTYNVAVYCDKGTGGLEAAEIFSSILKDEPSFQVKPIMGDQVRGVYLDQFDIIVMPGGSGLGEAKSLQPVGVEAVKRFVYSGKGYLGICAGAYFPIQQNFIDAETKSPLWRRGKATLDIELTDLGKQILGDQFGNKVSIYYNNGPVMNVNLFKDRDDCQVLAWFRSETAKNGTPKGIQINSPAMLLAKYGKGTILTSSPHPEKTDGLQKMVVNQLKYLAANLNYQEPQTPTGTVEQLRAKAVDYIRAMAQIEWTPKSDITWFRPKVGVVFKAGETYYGLPYTQTGRYTTIDQFEKMLDTSDDKKVYVGPTESSQYRGTDCSSSVTRAWRQINPTLPIVRTKKMIPGITKEIVAVGKYEVNDRSTKKIIDRNGAETMYAAYDLL